MNKHYPGIAYADFAHKVRILKGSLITNFFSSQPKNLTPMNLPAL